MMKNKPLSQSLEMEAKAFDRQIQERIQYGHIPDLRLTQPCDWFKNNIWRRPYLANLLFKPVLNFCLTHLQSPGSRILEVGCGPGYMSLELARYGYKVVGLDISAAALEAAERLAQQNPFTEQWGDLQYIRADFLDWIPADEEPFDAILFFGSLHHFSSPALVLDKAASLLSAGGQVIAYEPARDQWTSNDAAIMALIRVLLSTTGHWYQNLETPADLNEFKLLVDDCLNEIREAKGKDESPQSPMDNASMGQDMINALRQRFNQIAYKPDVLMFDRVGGGIRCDSEPQVQQVAQFLYAFERYALESGLMHGGWWMFAGEQMK